MKEFEFYKQFRLSNKKDELEKIFYKLHKVYKLIPETVGCLESIGRRGGCCSWCCKIQTPQLFYAEFLLIWNHVSKNFDNNQLINILEKCMINAVTSTPSKCCVFLDDKTNLCKIHEVRPYNCRLYGITPDDEFRQRYERLKEEYKNIKGAVLKEQCNLVKTTDGSIVDIKKSNKWWKLVQNIDVSLGIPIEFTTDSIGGSYRSPHDHILLYNMPDNVLNSLAGIKLYTSHQDKLETVHNLISCIKEFFRKK